MKKDKIIIGILSVALVSTLSVSGYVGYKHFSSKEVSEYETRVNEITEIDYSKRQEELDQIVEDGMMNVQYSLYATFEGKVSTSFNVKNIKNNKHALAFKLLDENKEVIYESKKIELGYEINSIELDKELAPGVHECYIQIGYVGEGNVSSIFPISLEIK